MPELSIIIAPVGKAGPLMIWINSFIAISGLFIVVIIPSHTSIILCGGTLVAMPTAIPELPLIKRLGIFEGKIDGSFNESSKLGTKLTVSLSISKSISSAILDKRASVLWLINNIFIIK